MRKLRDALAVEHPIVRVGYRLEECMFGDADAGPAEVHLSDVDRCQRRVPGCLARVQNVGLDDWVSVEMECRDVHGAVDDVLFQLVRRVGRVGQEEDVLAGAVRIVIGELAKHAEASGHVAIADVVLGPGGGPATLPVRRHDHVRGVDIRTVGLLRQPEAEQRSIR